jgi:hypothetical protein
MKYEIGKIYTAKGYSKKILFAPYNEESMRIFDNDNIMKFIHFSRTYKDDFLNTSERYSKMNPDMKKLLPTIKGFNLDPDDMKYYNLELIELKTNFTIPKSIITNLLK